MHGFLSNLLEYCHDGIVHQIQCFCGILEYLVSQSFIWMAAILSDSTFILMTLLIASSLSSQTLLFHRPLLLSYSRSGSVFSNSRAAPPKSQQIFPPLSLAHFFHFFLTPSLPSHLLLFQRSPRNTFLLPCLDPKMDSISDLFTDTLDLLTASHLAR